MREKDVGSDLLLLSHSSCFGIQGRLQGSGRLCEKWTLGAARRNSSIRGLKDSKPTNISVFVGEKNNDNLFTPIGDTGWVSAEAWSSAWGQAPLRVLARMLVVTVPVRHRFI